MSRDDAAAVALGLTERDMILEHVFVDSRLERRLELAEVGSGRRVVVRLTPDHPGRRFGFMAADASRTTEDKLERCLDALYDRLADGERRLGGGDD